MKTLLAAALLLAALPARAQDANAVPPEPLPAYLYNVAVFELGSNQPITVPWAGFAKLIVLPDEVHRKVEGHSLDTHYMTRLDVGGLARHLRDVAAATLVTNVAAGLGDVLQAPCGLGANLEIDFAGAAAAAGKPSTLRFRLFEVAGMDLSQGGTMSVQKGTPSEDVSQTYNTVEGDTMAIQVLRKGEENAHVGCVAIITP